MARPRLRPVAERRSARPPSAAPSGVPMGPLRRWTPCRVHRLLGRSLVSASRTAARWPRPAPPARAAKPALLAGACLVALLRPGAVCVPVRAQVLDQGALEAMFGEPVTTSATGKPQRASEAPANLEIITAEQIRRSGYDNLPDILRLVPGVDVRRYGFASAAVGIRGYNRSFNPRLLVLVNGQQVYLDDFGRTQWYALPVELDEIRQIEVVKGPNSALYGFNAASGVINIVTYDPLRDPVNAATARGGTQEYGALSAVGTARIADWGGVRVSLGGFRSRDFAPVGLPPRDREIRRPPERGSVAVDGRVRVAPGVEVTVNASAVNLRAAEVASTPVSSTGYYRTNSVRAAVAAETGLGLLALNFYRNESRYALSGAFGEGDLHDVLYVAQASDTVKLGADHTVRVGLEYRNSAADSSSNFAGRVGYEVASASLMWDWQIAPSLAATAAGRVDRFTLRQSGPLLAGSGVTAADYRGRALTEPSFNAGLVWHATESDTVRLTVGRGLQLPSLYNLGFQLGLANPSGVSVQFLGSPALRASATYNAELGYDRALLGLRSTVRAAVFAQRTDDVATEPFGVAARVAGRTVRFIAANTGRSSAVGGELSFRGQAPLGPESGLRWEASYAYISISDHLAVTPSALQDFQHGTPTHVVTLGGGYTLGRFELDAHGRWQSRYRDYRDSSATPTVRAISPVEAGNYVQLDARLAYRLTDELTLAFTARQFNVSRLLQSGGPPVERRLFLSATARF